MPIDFHTLSKEIVKDFLQTVVVVDDRAFFPTNERPSVKGVLTKPGFSENDLSLENDSQEDEVETDDHKHEELNAKELIDEFARNSIVCSVIRPSDEDEENLPEKIRNLANSCDLIVFDWHIGRDDGNLIKRLIREISIESAVRSKRNRLIAIYTGHGDLESVYKDIKKELNDAGISVQEDSSNFSFYAESIKIAIFAKPDSVYGKLKQREIAVRDLPERLITEFANMTEGLVSNVAIRSFSLIRENTHTILSKFNKSIDPAFLSHRIMLPIPDDANNLLESLIGAEITTLIEENEVGKSADADIIKQWLIEHPEIQNQFKKEGEAVDIEEIDEVFRMGLPAVGNEIKDDINSKYKTIIDRMGLPTKEKAKAIREKPHTLGLTKKFTGTNDENSDKKAHDADCNFAILTAIKSLKNKKPASLYFGTLLKRVEPIENKIASENIVDQDNKKDPENIAVEKNSENQQNTPIQKVEYLVCIQAPCDCVRLKEEREFLFLPLETVGDDSKFNLILRDGSDYTKVKVKYTPYDLIKKCFEPDTDRQQVLADDRNIFKCKDNSQYMWLGELKFTQIQRIVNKFAEQISRVGLDESEWLRLSATK